MTLIEAIKSGKRFRHPSWKNKNYWVSPPNRSVVLEGCEVDIVDLESSNWIVEEQKIELTREQIEKAWDKLAHPAQQMARYNPYLQALLKELGFSDGGAE